MKFSFLVLLILTISNRCFAQDIEITPVADESNDYYLSYADALTLRGYTISKNSELEFKNSKPKESAIYRANDNFNLGIGFNYKWVGLNLAFNFPFINKDNNIYGNTKAFDLQGNFYGRKKIIDVAIQTYEGFYWKNVLSKYPDLVPKETGFPQRKDIVTNNVSASMYHVFNHQKFSYRAAFVQNERQIKSAGSWILGGYFNLFGVRGKENLTLVPVDYLASIPDSSLHTQQITSSNLGITGGYAHTFVIKEKWFISLALNLGGGLKAVNRSTINNENITTHKGGGFVSGRFAIGHNNDRTFYGITSVTNTLNMQLEKDYALSYKYGAIRLIYARRLNIR